MQSRLALCPAWERPPFSKLLVEEETPGVGSCAERRGCRRAGGGHPPSAGGLGGQEGQRRAGSGVGHPGWLMLGWLLAALAALARGGTAAVPSFSCWKQCGSRWFLCSWPPCGPAGNTSYILTLCYVVPRLCQQFQAGARTTYTLKHHHIYVLTNATAWVEARWGDHVHRTPNLTLYLNEAVTCALGGNGAFEVQLRHKPRHWSSYWSDWSSSIFVPEEILESPALSYQLGNLGRDGQRVLRLGWQRAPEEQGDVTYTLRARMLACHCAEPAEEDAVVLGREVTAHNLTLSGAEYEILLTAANAAGTGPAQQLRVQAEQHADLGFKDVSVAGGTLLARWEAPSPGLAYCFEQWQQLPCLQRAQQLPPPAPKPGLCIRRDFPAKSIHVERGAVEAPACYRLAVHGWALARGWSTFALQHHYTGNASLAVPIRINASAGDATTVVLWWSPSPRAACPGALAKYLICHAAEGDNVTCERDPPSLRDRRMALPAICRQLPDYCLFVIICPDGEADATASHYTLQNLRPGTAYRVGVWEVTAESRGMCNAWWHFQTKALGPQGAAWKSNLKYLGISLSLPAVAAIYQLSKKRARRLLFPPLPKPMGSKAIQFGAGEMSQGQPRPGFVEPSESFSPAELLLTELNPGKEMTDAGTRPSTPQPSPTAKEPVAVRLLGCEKELPFAYRSFPLHLEAFAARAGSATAPGKSCDSC
ncbi:PREDICTED: interleukin-12 receptor subunit beta-1 [Nipponia nippon]|uniref:interleukin-12 receptor subunit beta-1 n=1 Tax=Nipponia nippon TaxID=128390 RepID=UPI0005113341|nr:PREDICTED: interleukin-12 receptor subunit beta-1 [Nipponia nippon]